MNFFFFWNFLSRVKCERNSWLKFISLFLSLYYPFWLKIMPERVFFNSGIFYFFFRNFLARVECEWNSGLKFFSHFHRLSHPILAKNNAGKSFFNFFNFFAIFFGIFLPGLRMNGIRVYNFFLSFSTYFIPLWLKIMLERSFLIFWIFFFFGIFFPGSSVNGIRD